MPKRPKNADVRSREHLTPAEVEKLLAAARRTGRYCDRDEALILITYRHGLRVSELVALKWDQFDLKAGLFHVRRRKNGTPSTHPVQGMNCGLCAKCSADRPMQAGSRVSCSPASAAAR
jgi:type 1 fimbriae regulatory protein FimB/type 1 fimbriae regulatory protein FimE